MSLLMDFVFGLGQVLVRTLWVKSVGSAHWLVRQWVISVTELSLDLKADKWQKSGWSLHCFWKSELWFRWVNESKIYEKTFFVHFGCRRIWSSLFFEHVLLKSLEYSMSCNTQVALDWTQGASNLGRNVYGLNNHGRPAWRVCALAEGWSSKKYLLFRKVLFPGQQGDVDEVQWCTGRRSSVACWKEKW